MSTPIETPTPGSTPVTEQKPDEAASQTPSTPSTEEKPAEGVTPETKPEDELPEWARKELTKVRGEAANYRTKLREAETSLQNAKTPEEFEAARSELSSRIAELEREVVVSKVARKYELPDELVPLLKGDNEEALELVAKTLSKYAVTPAPESLGGGLTPSDDADDEMDPRKLARRTRRR
ncbi:scaffolding protein [Streptomyces phage Verse]|uniref:Scaffolding protein n=2 Tax=Streptomyces phage Amela TaxID=1673877 RepID=A0A0K1YA56_9CAUD|nr:head scaffolding protein [Streptomyces phage Amela]AKY03764.1 scaffolding protein [Streptomyces phage Amela]AKY03839.1 scaffolding protein [Streptomyces phage Verse]